MSEALQAIILAGGRGSRLRPVLPDTPKILAPVDGRPFLDILLGHLAELGFARLHFSLGIGAAEVERHLANRDRSDVSLTRFTEPAPLGTGGAVLANQKHVDADPVFVINGDSIVRFDPKRMLAAHEAAGPAARITVLTATVDNAARYGAVRLDGTRIVQFGEKQASGSGAVNAGVYLMDRSLFEGLPPPDAPISLEETLLPRWVDEGRAFAFPADGLLLDIGTPESLGAAPAFLRAMR